jgi:cell division inhibitor SepF
MGIFGKKNKKDQFTNEPVESTYDKLIFEKLESDDDHYLTGLADKMIDGSPLILNFEPLDIDQANKVVAFFSGVVYAITGEIVHIQEKVFLFANKDVYKDGTIEEFLKEIVE